MMMVGIVQEEGNGIFTTEFCVSGLLFVEFNQTLGM